MLCSNTTLESGSPVPVALLSDVQVSTADVEKQDEETASETTGTKEEEKNTVYLVLGIEEIIKSYEPIQIYNWDRYLEMEKESFNIRWKRNTFHKLTRKDFKFLLKLGEGGFGKVVLVIKKDTKGIYAAKVLCKKKMKRTGVTGKVLMEKKILQSLRFPLTMYLDFNFNDIDYMYFIMPLASGGCLAKRLESITRMEENDARFYAGQIVLGLEYLHYLSLIYRDLKPDNVLIDHEGFVKLADFGFCKLLKGRTYTFCGTPDYMAPEILTRKGYGVAVDWWALGVVLYELCHGRTPFYSSKESRIYEKISDGKLDIPSYFSSNLQDLIWNLLQVDVTKRYGSMKRGVRDIKEHVWFKSIRWLDLANRKHQKPPHVPDMRIVVKPGEKYSLESFLESEKTNDERQPLNNPI